MSTESEFGRYRFFCWITLVFGNTAIPISPPDQLHFLHFRGSRFSLSLLANTSGGSVSVLAGWDQPAAGSVDDTLQ